LGGRVVNSERFYCPLVQWRPKRNTIERLTAQHDALFRGFDSREIAPPDPIESILFRMDQSGLQRKDLEPYIGHSGRVSEVLNRKRPLTLDMIRKLWKGLHIPLVSLIQTSEDIDHQQRA